MGVALLIVLVGLVIPITLIGAALVFDAGVLAWATYREWHDIVQPRLSALMHRAAAAASSPVGQYVHRPRHH